MRQIRPYGGILILPLAAMALVVAVKTLPDAYPQLTVVEALPAEATRTDIRAGGVTLLGYQLVNAAVTPGAEVRLWLYVSGEAARDAALFVTARDALTQTELGKIDTYPGQTQPSQFQPGVIYRVPIAFSLNNVLDMPQKPHLLDLILGWQFPEDGRYVPWTLDDGSTSNSLKLHGPVLVDPAYHPFAPQVRTDIVYGDLIRLMGYAVAASEVKPGDTVNVILDWGYLNPTSTDWTLAVGLLDDANTVITSADGMPPGYPTSVWQPGSAFQDTRTLVIPSNTPPGEYRLYVGWYRIDTGERLTPRGEHVEDTLYIAPTKVRVVK